MCPPFALRANPTREMVNLFGSGVHFASCLLSTTSTDASWPRCG